MSDTISPPPDMLDQTDVTPTDMTNGPPDAGPPNDMGPTDVTDGTGPNDVTGPNNTGPNTGPTTTMASTQDTTFVQQALTAGQTEIAEANLALTNSQNIAVTEYARWMIADHTLAGNQLTTIAQQEGNTTTTTPPTGTTTTPPTGTTTTTPPTGTTTTTPPSGTTTLQNLHDPEFAATYITNAVKDHTQVVMQFLQETKTGQDPAVVSFAQQQLPVLEQHLEAALVIQAAMQGKALTSTEADQMVASLVPGLPPMGGTTVTPPTTPTTMVGGPTNTTTMTPTTIMPPTTT